MLRPLLHAGLVLALATAAYGQSEAPGTGSANENVETSASVTEPLQSTIPKVTADHAKFKKLQGPFASASDVTKACLTCHNEAGKQVTQSIHWTWETHNPTTGQTLGKKTVLNSFCGNLATNETRCTSCHAGYGWTETKSFDFKDETKVDCLACHDTMGEYIKWPTDAGHPLYTPKNQSTRMEPYAEALVVKEPDGTFTHLPPDLAKIAANVGRPRRDNCGNCHFFGGGGDNVKHGDLSTALLNPSPHVDVHMSPQGANMVCVDCHVGDGHEWPGSRYQGTLFNTSPKRAGMRNTNVLACNSCHTSEPHAKLSLRGAKLNDHTDRVACQTCHIPEFAKGGVATKTWWDWSTAGKLKEGKPYAEEDEKGRHTYLSIKGNFEWDEDVIPDYAFWNGRVDYTLLGDKIDPTGIVGINQIGGGADIPGSVIFPFKRMRGKQAYDAINNYLIQSNVYGPEGDTALWSNYNWDKALAAGMAASDVPYSGKYGFVETEMWWPTTHMVAPANEALKCGSCHAKDGRLAKVAGVYIPGRDGFAMTDRVGLILLSLALVGIAVHTGLRILTRRNNKGE